MEVSQVGTFVFESKASRLAKNQKISGLFLRGYPHIFCSGPNQKKASQFTSVLHDVLLPIQNVCSEGLFMILIYK